MSLRIIAELLKYAPIKRFESFQQLSPTAYNQVFKVAWAALCQ